MFQEQDMLLKALKHRQAAEANSPQPEPNVVTPQQIEGSFESAEVANAAMKLDRKQKQEEIDADHDKSLIQAIAGQTGRLQQNATNEGFNQIGRAFSGGSVGQGINAAMNGMGRAGSE